MGFNSALKGLMCIFNLMKFPFNLLRPVLKVGFRKPLPQPQGTSLLGCEYCSMLVMQLLLTVPGVVFSNQMQTVHLTFQVRALDPFFHLSP